MRRYAYLDHIRWMTVLLVIVYHVCYLFNGVGIFGGVPNARNLPFLDTISGTVYPGSWCCCSLWRACAPGSPLCSRGIARSCAIGRGSCLCRQPWGCSCCTG